MNILKCVVFNVLFIIKIDKTILRILRGVLRDFYGRYSVIFKHNHLIHF